MRGTSIAWPLSSSGGWEEGPPLRPPGPLPEVWVRDLAGGTLEVYRGPSAEGYRDVRLYRRGDRVSLLAFPDLVLEVSAILG